jgi:hypothetical protein
MVNSKQVRPAAVRISTGARLGTEVRQGATTSEMSWMIYRTGARHLPFDIPCCSHRISATIVSRPGSSRYDPLESSHRGCHIATGQARRNNHSPYSEPAVLVASYDSAPSAPRPRSSSAALDRGGGPVVPQVSCSSTHCFTQLAYVDPPSGIRSSTWQHRIAANTSPRTSHLESPHRILRALSRLRLRTVQPYAVSYRLARCLRHTPPPPSPLAHQALACRLK